MEKGLTSRQVVENREKFGTNQATREKNENWTAVLHGNI